MRCIHTLFPPHDPRTVAENSTPGLPLRFGVSGVRVAAGFASSSAAVLTGSQPTKTESFPLSSHKLEALSSAAPAGR
jgi:hypothetical protein